MEQPDPRRIGPTRVTPFAERRTVDHEAWPGLARWPQPPSTDDAVAAALGVRP